MSSRKQEVGCVMRRKGIVKIALRQVTLTLTLTLTPTPTQTKAGKPRSFYVDDEAAGGRL